MDNESLISNNRHFIFRATYRGERYRFHAAEHFNEGLGWMLLDVDETIKGVVCSSNVTDIEFTDETYQDFVTRKYARRS